MRVWTKIAWVALAVLGCAGSASGDGSSRSGRSMTLRAEVRQASGAGRAAERPSADPKEPGLEAFDGAATPTRAALVLKRGDRQLGLPLQSSSFDSFVVGTVAETVVTQRYLNSTNDTIEAVYVFPLPHDGAVYDYSIRVQDRTLRGQMKRRDEARALYQAAKQAGHTAGLLEQERPNIFTQSVANIPPREMIEVELHVVQPLAREDGRYRLVLPTVVGPRYVPGTPKGPVPKGSFAPDTDRVSDGSRITPMPLRGGAKPSASLSISVAIENGARVADVRSKHHDVDLHDEDGVAYVSLTDGSTVADRDFELSWSEAGAQPQASLMVQPEEDGDGGYFTLTLEPPRALPLERAVPRELVFVVDTSGSMQGTPIETAKATMRRVLRQLGPSDVFQIVTFSQAVSSLAPGFVKSTPEGVERGLRFLDTLQGEGGTEMLAGVRAALELRRQPERMRMVLFLTDGYIGNETEIFGAVRQRIGDARLFSLGVGDAVNRYLLDGLARMGRGEVSYMASGEPPDAVVDRFYRRIDRPVMTDVSIDWGGLAVEDVEPAQLPDLFQDEPVVVFGRYHGAPSGELLLRARGPRGEVHVPIAVDFRHPRASSAALSASWARARIGRLSDELIEERQQGRDPSPMVERITQLALQHRVMTEYTAFVAVDSARSVRPGTKTEHVPVAMPSNVSEHGVFGTEAAQGSAGIIGVKSGNVGTGYGLGGLGVVGTGRGGGGTALGSIGTIGHGAGGGSGYGRGAGAFHGRDATVVRVRTGKSDVRGALSKELVRRITHRHINELRFCYEQSQSANLGRQGRIEVRFVISPTGGVTVARVVVDELGDAKLARCVTDAVQRWSFPAPEGHAPVTVTMPYHFDRIAQP